MEHCVVGILQTLYGIFNQYLVGKHSILGNHFRLISRTGMFLFKVVLIRLGEHHMSFKPMVKQRR